MVLDLCGWLLLPAGERRLTPGLTATRLLASLYSNERRTSALSCSQLFQCSSGPVVQSPIIANHRLTL